MCVHVLSALTMALRLLLMHLPSVLANLAVVCCCWAARAACAGWSSHWKQHALTSTSARTFSLSPPLCRPTSAVESSPGGSMSARPAGRYGGLPAGPSGTPPPVPSLMPPPSARGLPSYCAPTTSSRAGSTYAGAPGSSRSSGIFGSGPASARASGTFGAVPTSSRASGTYGGLARSASARQAAEPQSAGGRRMSGSWSTSRR